MKRRTWFWYEGVTLVVVMLAAFGVYARMLGAEFLWDDSHLILENERLRGANHLGQILTSDFWQTETGSGTVEKGDLDKLGYYRPVVTLSYFIEYRLWGRNPLGYHLVNLLLHALVTGLVYLLSREFLKRWLPRFAAALLFAVHPVHAESVAPIWGRTDLLCGLFLMLALFFFLRIRKREEASAENGKSPRTAGLWAASLVLFILALFSKEMAVVLPFLVFLLDWQWFRKDWKTTLKGFIPFAIILALYLVIRLISVGTYGGGRILNAGGVFGTLLTMMRITLSYLRLMIWPLPLNSWYLVDPTTSFSDNRLWIPLVILGLVIVGLTKVRRSAPVVFVGGLWFLLLQLPVANLFPIGGVMMAERFLYLPSVGFCLLAGAGIEKGLKVHGVGESALGLVVLFTIFFGWLTWNRTQSWLTEYNFFQAMVLSSPSCYVAHNNYGRELLKLGKNQDAESEFRKAIELESNFAMAHHNLGQALFKQGEYGEAKKEFLLAVKLKPQSAPIHNSLGKLYEVYGFYEVAEREYREALKLEPRLAEAHNNYGLLLLARSKEWEAEKEFREAIQLKPELAEAHLNLGILLLHKKSKYWEAEQEFRKSIQLKPELAKAHFQLGTALGTQGKYSEAENEFREAVRLSPDWEMPKKVFPYP